MATLKLFQNGTQPINQRTFACATFNFENAVRDTDYVIQGWYDYETWPGTGETIKLFKFFVPLAGVNRILNYTTDPNSNANIILPTYYHAADGYYDINGATEITERPADWEYGVYYKYFERELIGEAPSAYYNYKRTSATWDDTKQYYYVPNLINLYYSANGGYFGVSRKLAPTSSSNLQDRVVFLYDVRTTRNSSNWDATYWYHTGGINGNLIYNLGYTMSSGALIDTFDNIGGSVADMTSYQTGLLCQMVNFEYDGEEYYGVMTMNLGVDLQPLNATISALNKVFWREPYTPGYSGPTSKAYGYNGTYSGTDERKGKRGRLSAVKFGNVAPGHSGLKLVKMKTSTLSSIPNQYYNEIISSSSTTGYGQWITSLKTDPQGALSTLQSSILNTYKLAIEPGTSEAATTSWQVMNLPFTLPGSVWWGFDRYEYKDLGTVDLSRETWHDSYLDYEPYTQINVYLPFIGTYALPVSDVMGGILSLEYYQDNINGDLLARLTCENAAFPNEYIQSNYCPYAHLIGQFVGNGLAQIPFSLELSNASYGVGKILSSAIQSAFKSGSGNVNLSAGRAISNRGSLTAKAQGIGALKAASNITQQIAATTDTTDKAAYGIALSYQQQRAASAAAKATKSMALGKAAGVATNPVMSAVAGAMIGATNEMISQYQPACQAVLGSYAGNAGFMSDPQPYIQIVRTLYEPPETQAHEKGFPTNISLSLSNLPRHSFNVCSSNIDFPIPANSRMTSVERAAIVEILNQGFYR